MADEVSTTLSGAQVNTFEDFELPLRPTPAEFDVFVPWACYQLGVELPVVITRNFQSQYISALGKDRAKSKILKRAKSKTPSESVSDMNASSADMGSKMPGDSDEEKKTIQIETTYDEYINLVRIKFLKGTTIPRLVLKVIGLAIPYHRTLVSVIINKGLTAETLYELSNYYRSSRLTEICLDNTYLAEANYHLLLDNDCITHLSLSKCHINDVVVKTLALKLTAARPAAKSLSALNLSTNIITDVGVKYIADMLRTNRRISYLNLADNRITDEGAINIFKTLTEFTLTKTESLEKSKRIIAYIKEKNELIAKTMIELRSGDYDKKFNKNKKSVRPIIIKKKPETSPVGPFTSEANYAERAENIADDIMGVFKDPFSPEHTRYEDNAVICNGNNTLSYLNLAFNNLSYTSVKKLCDVIRSQNYLFRKPRGLINVRIEGNYLPETCQEFVMIDNILMAGLGIAKVDPLKKKTASRIFKNAPLE